MKKATIYLFAAIVITSGLTSCKKVYECQCTDPAGNVKEQTIEANTRDEAQKNCSDLTRIGSCEIK